MRPSCPNGGKNSRAAEPVPTCGARRPTAIVDKGGRSWDEKGSVASLGTWGSIRSERFGRRPLGRRIGHVGEGVLAGVGIRAARTPISQRDAISPRAHTSVQHSSSIFFGKMVSGRTHTTFPSGSSDLGITSAASRAHRNFFSPNGEGELGPMRGGPLSAAVVTRSSGRRGA